MVVAEWRLLTRGLRWWYSGPLVVALLSVFMPLEHLRSTVLPIAFIWPVLRWSRLGSAERRHGTEAILFSAPHPLSRQLPAAWVAGIGTGILVTGSVALRLAFAGEMQALATWAAGLMFAPALALALGVWTGSGKFFEALYAFLWYAMIQKVPAFDFAGSTPAGADGGNALSYAALSAVLFVLAVAGRRHRLTN